MAKNEMAKISTFSRESHHPNKTLLLYEGHQ